jgi:hypothetical protein
VPRLAFGTAQTSWRRDRLIKLIIRHIAAVNDVPQGS